MDNRSPGAPVRCRVRLLSEVIRDGEAERMELECVGEYLFSPGKTVISYVEDTGYGPVPNTVTVTKKAAGDKADIRRGDALHLELVCGEKRSGQYLLPFGSIELEYITEELTLSLDESGGRIVMLYAMDTGGAESENRVELEVRTAAKGDTVNG